MVTTTDSEATPTGMYVADLTSGTIEKALTPQVMLWEVSFSPDRTQVAYRTFQWIPIPNSMPEMGPPFTLNMTNLTTGITRILLKSEADQYFLPIWSGDGNRLAFTVREDVTGSDLGLFAIDLTTEVTNMVVPGSENSRLIPWGWLSDDRIANTQGDLSSGNILNPVTTLYTISAQGTEKHLIDSEVTTVLGVIDN